MIKCLPKEVQGKLRSGVAIPSLQQCVEELILNSIDAGATCVGVRMDMDAFKVQVIDNGAGLSSEDMEYVGNRYHTSKCHSVEDLEHLRFYGFRGEALASIVSLATLVEISSRTNSSVKTHVRIFKDGKGLAVFEAETSRPSAGTTVVICNFFHNMPVRRKRMDAILESERIRHRVEAISLMHPSVSFTLKNDCTGVMTVQLPKARNTYHRFVQIHSLGRAQKLGEISYTHRQFEVIGYIGREGHYNNSLQFLYVNDRLLLKTRIHKLLNFLLRRLSSTNQKNDNPDGQSATKSPKHKRSQEQYGVYIVNIKCSYSEYDICLEPAKTLIEFKDWDGLLVCVEEAVKAFLKRENLMSVVSQDNFEDYVSSQSFSTDRTNQESYVNDKGVHAASSSSKIDCSIGVTLASEAVHRKCNYITSVHGKQSNPLEYKDEEELQQKMVSANDLDNSQLSSQECLNKESDKDESRCHLGTATTEPAMDDNSNVEELTLSKADEFSHISCVLTSVEQIENKQLEPPEERDMNITITNSVNHQSSSESITKVTQPDPKCTEPILPGYHHTEGHQQTSSTRKITISEPFIHESLQIEEQPESACQQQDLSQIAEERCFSFKHKISLVTSKRTSQNDFNGLAPVIPPKIPRIISQYKEPGSLDCFRRMYGKCDKLKPPTLETHSQNSAWLPQRNSVFLNVHNPFVCKKDATDIKEGKRQSNLQSPPTLSDFTKLKPVSSLNTEKKSLAAKLCHLKCKKGASHITTHIPTTETSSETNTSFSSGHGGIQDSNNDNPCNWALHCEPASAHSINLKLAEKEQDTTPDDWLHHYDSSVGKTVYINKVTGLSRYEDPALDGTQAPCTSDVTNMAVSIISETGDSGESSNSLFSMYSKWNNPVFVQPPSVGLDISSGHADGLVVKIHNILFPYRFSKAMIHSMKVIDQVDKKFLACLINTREEEPAGHSETEENLLVLVDQHAAHERVRLESLIADSYEDDPDAPGERRLSSSTISPPLQISVTEDELRLLRSCQSHLRSLGLEVKFSLAADPQVLVGKVPLCFMEKESNERRRGRPSVIKPIVEEYLQEQIEMLRSAGRVRGSLPLTVLKVLASLACHGAIKFNDSLSKNECHSLIASLSACKLPFQCAHGRPSIAPLVDILHLSNEQKEQQRLNLTKLRRMCKAWELFGDR
ncbi:DNA mismatch repair protein Mlh3 isoform X2 [Sphaeramia orbicularis]|uniref:DNA mismatch repair protein Mlh3 isoform X2 n=1 Tax=Sphaeramia orbicularis TaxID=375764 RepID=UPI00117FAC08|nr:DNA mismatch repair protein Mlh3 isoform X2 [Sphaeramia orbicularis]